MAKLDWLEKNDYLEQEIGKEYAWAAWLLWGIALLLLLIPVRGSALHQYYVITAEDTPSLTGHIIRLEPSHGGRGIRGGKGGHYKAEVEIEYRGESYRVTNVGFNFTHAMYEKARATGRVPVYLNRACPEESVLSKGVPFLQYFATGLFAAISLALIVGGILLIRRK